MAERRRDALGTTVALLTFLGGVGLIVATFLLARSMFAVSPYDALNIEQGKTLDLNNVLVAGMAVVIKVVLLIVMAGFGSAIATRGIKLYVQTGSSQEKKG